MLKSLFSGVAGLQSHQVAMDVESNNIANVNTVGFKYSRANFSDLLAQTKAIATAPQGALGGKNPVQVGLGATVSSMTRIFSQGSVQNSDKNLDMAIQGDGFFIVSPDGGNTYKYTRSGDFKFDAAGNFVDNNGFTAQGWLRDGVTGKVDSTAPVVDINIPPGLTTPANATTEVVIKANLNSGHIVESFSAAYEVPTGTPPSRQIPPVYTGDAIDKNGNPIESGDMGVMFTESGEALALQKNQGVWISFIAASTTGSAVTASAGTKQELDITFEMDNGDLVNVTTSNGSTTETADSNGARYVSAINAQRAVTGIEAVYDTANNTIILTNQNGNANASHNIRISAVGGTDNSGFTTGSVTTAYRYQYDPSGQADLINQDKKFTSISDLRYALEEQANAISTYSSTAGISNAAGDDDGIDFTLAGTAISVADSGVANQAADVNAQRYVDAINAAGITGVTAQRSGDDVIITSTIGDITLDVTSADAGQTGWALGTTTIKSDVQIAVSSEGKFEISNGDDYDINLRVTGMTADSIAGGGITENTYLTKTLSGMNAVLPAGTTGKAYSQAFNAATHSSSIDVFDSLGSKHTLRTEFRKTAVDAATGSTWDITITVPEPATIDTVAPLNEKKGSIRFNNDGSLATYNPPNVSFTANNGSAPNQQVNLSFGTANKFDGMTSFDSRSSTSGISQDGYTGGDLVGIRIDQSGTLVGSFSNGRSMGLAQISMAKFTNNEGLSTEGGNIFNQTANSGDPIIGVAATSGRGFIQSSALEASNVDLSRALTQLIIVQRGFQANGKTITTSDQMLQTLIGLKQ